MKLGMQDVSVVLASGDPGVAGPAGDGNADGCLSTGQIFSPDFPATCPYITTVGATYLPPGANVNTDAEVAVTRFGSGGGFSNIYPIPPYRSKAVSTYLTQHTPPYKAYSGNNNQNIGAGSGIYNNAGRGYPDVSAVGDNIVIFSAGLPTLIGGTSASAPVFSAILNRINEERLAVGKATVGFVNPTLVSSLVLNTTQRTNAYVCLVCQPTGSSGYHHRRQSRVQYRRLLSFGWMGSRHRSGYTKLPSYVEAFHDLVIRI